MLSKRQELILKTIIKDFTHSHEPVGSKTVMSQLPVKVSSATIRNEMALLEEQGLLEKTHSSSGRVPSMEGYRYYLDHLVEPLALPEEVYEQIGYQLDQPFNQVDEIVKEATKILSDLTNYTAIVQGPESSSVTVTGFRIVPLSAKQVMAILVTSDGSVHNQIYSLPRHINGDEIERAVRLINEQLVGKELKDIDAALLNGLSTDRYGSESMGDFLNLLKAVIQDAASEQMYVNGQINLLTNAQVQDRDEVKSLYDMMGRTDLISDLLSFGQDSAMDFPVQVHLGSEMPSSLLKNYSLLTAQYRVGRYGKGTIALLGPTDMPYSQMIGLMDYFKDQLGKTLLDYYGRLR